MSTLTCGGRLTHTAYGAGGAHVFTCCGTTVRVVSLRTGVTLHYLSGHAGEVTGLAVNPQNTAQLLTSGLDGSLRVWDYSDGICLKTYQVGAPLLGVEAPSSEPGTVYLVTKLEDAKADPKRDRGKGRSSDEDDAEDGEDALGGKAGGKSGAGGKAGAGAAGGAGGSGGRRQQRAVNRWRVVAYSLTGEGKVGRTVFKMRGRFLGFTARAEASSSAVATGGVGSNLSLNAGASSGSGSSLGGSSLGGSSLGGSGGVMGGGIVGGGTLVATINRRKLSVWSSSSGCTRKWTHRRRLTTLAMHPTEDYIATGDSVGEINLCYILKGIEGGSTGGKQGGGAGSKPYSKPSNSNNRWVTTKMHWHAHAVSALSFAGDGRILMSGGEEAVLVLWQIGSGDRTFLPRLGGTITNIATSPTPGGLGAGAGGMAWPLDAGVFVSVTCGDNSVRFR